MRGRVCRTLVGTVAAVAGVAAIAPGVRAADEGVVAAGAAPVAVAPTAATVGGEPTAVLAGPGTTTVQLPFRVSLTRVDTHPTLPSGGLSVAVVVARDLELSLAATVIPMDAVYGPADARLGARVGLGQAGALRVALLAGLHAPFAGMEFHGAFAADAGLALTECRDQACRASATLFGTVDRHYVTDGSASEAEIHFERSQAAAGASATLPFSSRGSVFASGRASTTFGCGNAAGSLFRFNPCSEGPATLLTATAGARVTSLDGRHAFDLAASVVRGRLEQFNIYRSVPYAAFVGVTFTTALGGRGP